ncbi:MAG: chromate transporter [Rhizobiales bacterium 65-9]|nr:chromate transporter [Hyphomicrobiales bacterium]OJY38372.1 MAG: chromate transporter [Rhizobiales bacterium 65-9]
MPRTIDDPAPPTPLALFLIFTRIGLTSFGGGLSGWLFREFVADRGWLSEDEFLNGLALAQALPGVNVTNMAIWIGHRLAGFRGAAASVAGIVALPGCLIILIGASFAWLSRFPVTHTALVGASAASIGLSFTMAFATARRVVRKARPLLFMGGTFVAVALLQWPLVWVVIVAGAASVALEYADLTRS